MLRSKCEVYIHFVWTTWQRERLLTGDVERPIHRCIAAEADKLGCSVLALDGTDDHVHVLPKIPTTVTIATLAKQMKGSSSTLGRSLTESGFFGWQDRYGAFSVSRWDVRKVMNYICNQKRHHSEGTAKPDLEESEEFAD